MTRGQLLFDALSLRDARAIQRLVKGAPWNGRIKLSQCCAGECGQLIFFTDRGRVTVTRGFVCYNDQRRIWPDRASTNEDLIAASLYGEAHRNADYTIWLNQAVEIQLVAGRDAELIPEYEITAKDTFAVLAIESHAPAVRNWPAERKRRWGIVP
jgi:hypothetical protein